MSFWSTFSPIFGYFLVLLGSLEALGCQATSLDLNWSPQGRILRWFWVPPGHLFLIIFWCFFDIDFWWTFWWDFYDFVVDFWWILDDIFNVFLNLLIFWESCSRPYGNLSQHGPRGHTISLFWMFFNIFFRSIILKRFLMILGHFWAPFWHPPERFFDIIF